MKKAFIVAGIVLVVVVVLAAILISNLDRVVSSKKDYILARAEKQVGRKVSVDEIKVGVWPGIGVSLKNVVVADDPEFSTEPFVRVADLRVNVKLMPLLRKRVEVKRLVLNDPAITVIIDENGRHNFDSMAAAAGEEAAPGNGGAEAPPAGAAATALVLAYADIENGSVHIIDRARGFDHTVGAIHFTAQDVSLDSEISFEFAAALVGADPDTRIEGKIGPLGEFTTVADLSNAPLDATVAFGPVGAPAIFALLPAGAEKTPPDALGVGEVDMTLAVRGTLGALRLDDVVASAAVLGAKPKANATLRAGVTGINALVPGDRSAVNVKGEVRVDPVPLSALRAFAKVSTAADPAKPAPEFSGNATFDLKFDGSPDQLSLHAAIDADGATVKVGETLNKPAGVAMGATLDGVLRASSLEVSHAEIRFNDLRAVGSGVLGPEAFDLTFTSDPTDVSKWRDLVPALAPLSPTGSVALRVHIAGSPAAGTPPQVDGTLTLTGGGATLAQLPKPVHDATATVSFKPGSARVEKASFTVGRSVFNAAVQIPRLEPLEATYRVTSDRIWRDDVQASAGTPSPRPEVLDKVVAEGRAWRETTERVDHKGTITSASGIIANLDYTDLNAATRSDGDAIVIEKYSARLLDGSVEGSGRVEPLSVPPRFDITTQVRNVDLARYFDQKFPALGKFIEGRVDLDLSLAGAGKEWVDIAKTLKGSGDAVVVRGALLNFNLVDELLAGLQTVPLVPSGFTDRVRARNPKLFASSATAFENLKGDLTFENGRMNAGGLVLKAADFTISGDGWFAFDRTMDLNSTVVFSQKLSGDIVGELPIAKYLLDGQGRIALPLSLAGDVLSPRFGLDTNILAAKFRQSAVDEGRDKLQGQIKEGVKDLLGGFGKKNGGTKDAVPDSSKTRKAP